MAEMKASAPTKVEIYYDVVSPYTWLGFDFEVIFLFTYIPALISVYVYVLPTLICLPSKS